MEPVKRRSLGALAVLAAALAVRCDLPKNKDNRDCVDICKELATCEFLPSVLGAMSTPLAPDAAVNADNTDCELRCQISSTELAYRKIDNCWSEVTAPIEPPAAQCADFGQCLHAQFPDSPATGISDVRLQAVFEAPNAQPGAAAAADGGNPLVSCDPDGGAGGMLVRAFIEVWGTRRYSERRTCPSGLLADFESVPAMKDVPYGFQLYQGGQCLEYGARSDIPAGYADYRLTINLAASTGSGCPSDSTDASAGPNAPAPTGGGEQ